MGWQADGTVLRENPDFNGDDVWQQDQAAGIKIIDARHDHHDEDLALAIADCLNLDGLNAMRANLDMGGFTIINLPVGTDPGDIATLGDTITDAYWDDPNLVLVREVGNLVVELPIGGGAGTVTSIEIGAGLSASPGTPITTTGTISIPSQAGVVAGTYTNADVTVNARGIITSIENGDPGAGTDVDLSMTQSSSVCRVNNTGGDDATIAPVTASIRGIVTPTLFTLWNRKDIAITQSNDEEVSVAITGAGGAVGDIALWDDGGAFAGVFSGEITEEAPAQGVASGTHGKPIGYIWFEVDTLA